MTTVLWQAAVSAGKTQAALERLSQRINDPQRPFAKIWVLLATRRQEVAFRQRLIDLQDGRAVYFNAEFFNFYTLNERLLNLAANPQRRISVAARAGLLRKIFTDLQRDGQLPAFAPIVRTPGFLRVVADLLDELKQHRIEPDDFAAAGETQKDRELALIYQRYQQFLIDSNLVDREGEGWVALDAVRHHPDLASDVSLLIVDGYDQFTAVQADLLAQLSTCIEDVFITLTQAPDDRLRPDDEPVIGRRFASARERLRDAHQAINAAFDVQTVIPGDQPVSEHRHPDLVTLTRNIFSGLEPVPASGGLHLIEAPDPQTETAVVLRHVKRLLLDGTPPDDILIALRDWPRYHTYMDLYRQLYDLPLLLHYGVPADHNPALTTLMSLLALPGNDPDAVTAFRRRDLLDVLRSPYVDVPGFTAEVIDNLDKVSRKRQVLGGRQNWLEAVRSADQPPVDEDGETEHEPLLTTAEQADLSTALEDFFNELTRYQQATHEQFVIWLERLIGHDQMRDPSDLADEELAGKSLEQFYSFNIPACIRRVRGTGGDFDADRLENRDVQALNQFKELLRGMLATQEFLRSTFGDAPPVIHWQDFLADLQSGLRYMPSSSASPGRSGRVLVTSAAEARGLPHAHTFILGLSEGIFPMPPREDPLYLDSERLRFQQKDVPLPTQAERSDDDGIFYELISQPSHSLTLSRPHVREGKSWVESHLWRMVRDVFTGLKIERIGIGQVVPPLDVATRDEAAITTAHALSYPPSDQRDAYLALHHWLALHHDEYWTAIEHGRVAEMARLSREPYGSYTGLLQNPDLIEIIADELGDNYLWSATRLSAYGTCPYRFFAGYMLRLEELREPQEGMDALQLGSLNHKILEETYREFAVEGATITPDNLSLALSILDEKAADILPVAPDQYGFRASALWQQEQDVLLRRLRHLIEIDFSDDAPLNELGSPRRPYQFELPFGFDKDVLRLHIGGEALRVRGVIDRIDIAGDRLIVIDYKTGSTKIKTAEMAAGRNFQMMLYLQALKAHTRLHPDWPQQIAGGAFFHIRNATTSGEFDPQDETDIIAMEAAEQHIVDYLARIRCGDFTVQPAQPSGHRCTSYCEFYQLCRLSMTNQHKH